MRSSSWHIPNGQKESPFPPDPLRRSPNVTYRLLESARTPGCITNSVVARSLCLPLLQPAWHQAVPGRRRRSAVPTATALLVMLLSNMRTGYVEIHGGVEVVAFLASSSMDYGDAPESYGVAGSGSSRPGAAGERLTVRARHRPR